MEHFRSKKGVEFGYLAKLDHLRFAAAMMVLLFHVELFTGGRLWVPAIDQGHIGVAMFMGISGMILTMITYGRRVDVLRFYANRAVRIYPLFVAVVALGYFATPDPRPTSTGVDFLMALLPISNMYRNGYGTYGGALWSIAVELQFYLLFPVLLASIEKHGWLFAAALITLLIGVRGAIFVLNGTVHHLAYFSLFGALDQFLLGMVAGRLYMSTQFRLPAWLPVTLFAALNVMVAVLFRGDFFHVSMRPVSPSALWIIWPTMQAVTFAALLFSYLRSPLTLPFSRTFAWLGKISYSIYAWHIMVLMLVLKLSGNAYVVIALAVPATLVFAALSYYAIERPFLTLRRSYTRDSTDACQVPRVVAPPVMP